MSNLKSGYRLLGARSVDLNVVTDQAFVVSSAKYIPDQIFLTDASVNLGVSVAAGGIYTAVSKGGTAIVPSTQVFTVLTGSGLFLPLTLALASTVLTGRTLYFSLTTAHGSAATANLWLFGWALDSID